MSIFDEARNRISAGSSNTVNASQNTQNVFEQARSRIASGQTISQPQIAPAGGSLGEKATAPGYSESGPRIYASAI